MVLCAVICFVENRISTCAYESFGSEGQNVGIFTVTVFVATAAFEADDTFLVGVTNVVSGSVDLRIMYV